MGKKVVVLGAGYAGIETALKLYNGKRKNEEIEITLIDRNSYHTLLTELHEVAGNRIDEDGIIVRLKDIFEYTDVRLVRDEIKKIDMAGQKLVSGTAEYGYDYLVVATGSKPNFYGIPGMEENSFSLWSYNDALKIREHIKDCFLKASEEKDPAKRAGLLTFAVGGGGFTGVEMIGELALWVKDLCGEYSINPKETRLLLVEALPKILANMKDTNIAKSFKYLTNRLKVEVLANSPIVKAEPGAFELGDGRRIDCKTLIWTAGVTASNICDENDFTKSKGNRIIVDKDARMKYPNIYAVGDVSAFSTENGTLPALVESALQTGKGAAHNILADIRGKEITEVKPKLHGVMVSIGSYFATSDVMGVRWPRLISILLKYLVNVHYLFGIGGFELVFSYIKHEFLHKKQDKTIIERHVSVLTPTFWLVPIRLFLGYCWLKEGLTKVGEGWFVKPMLAGMAADAGSSASVTETGEKVFRIISEHTPNWYAWIANQIVIPNAQLFQILIVLAELALGLAFLSGAFTFIASIASIGLIINFMLSTGFYDYNWWYIPAALSLLGGSGRAFGLDYYIMPYLMRQWRYFTRNKRIRLFMGISREFAIILAVLLVLGIFLGSLVFTGTLNIAPVEPAAATVDATSSASVTEESQGQGSGVDAGSSASVTEESDDNGGE